MNEKVGERENSFRPPSTFRLTNRRGLQVHESDVYFSVGAGMGKPIVARGSEFELPAGKLCIYNVKSFDGHLAFAAS
jgi:hypothetical protein